MKRLYQQGFTLIELLIVVAIIGILSAIVLISLNQARDEANDAARMASLTEVGKQAELYFASNEHYGTNTSALNNANVDSVGGANNCNDGGGTGMCADAEIRAVAGPAAALTSDGFVYMQIAADGTDYAMWITLSSGVFCVDSTGNKTQLGSALADNDFTCG